MLLFFKEHVKGFSESMSTVMVQIGLWSCSDLTISG